MSKCVAELIRILAKLPPTAHVDLKINGISSLSYPIEKITFAKKAGIVRLETAEQFNEEELSDEEIEKEIDEL